MQLSLEEAVVCGVVGEEYFGVRCPGYAADNHPVTDIVRHFFGDFAFGFGEAQSIDNILLGDFLLQAIFQHFFVTDFGFKPCGCFISHFLYCFLG